MDIMTMPIEMNIIKTTNSRLPQLDFNDIQLGKTFTDHMLICDYEDGKWGVPTLQPLEAIATHPAAMALHYGQAIFEGMKVTLSEKTGNPLLFRPEQNAKRLNHSAARMGMPNLPEHIFLAGLKAFVDLERGWIPSSLGSALYLRPFMYADEAFIGMRAANHYKFVIIASPAGPLFTKRVDLMTQTQYIRAAQGGTGEAKAAGNYAAAILPTEQAKNLGYDQVLWLDANEFRYIQEVGTMNIFFLIDNTIVTPSADGAILKGITRDSVLTILKDFGYTIEERPITIDELIAAHEKGILKEAFGTGTASSISFINAIAHKEQIIKLPEDNPVGIKTLDYLNDIKSENKSDPYNWMHSV